MGLGGFINKAGEALEAGVDGFKRGAGEAIEFGADKVADGLEAVGADGAAKTVRSAGEDMADGLGAQVDERQLGETDDPKQLVHGDTEALNETARHLKDFHAAFDSVAQGMRKLDNGGWKGKAADSFHKKFQAHPKTWMHAADACEQAYKALDSYADTVGWAQRKARTALEKYKAAEAASKKALDAHNAKVDAYNSAAKTYNAAVERGDEPGKKPQEPGKFTDPGDKGRKEAEELLKDARRQRNEAAERAQGAIKKALAHAPDKPTFTQFMTLDFIQTSASASIQLGHVAGGLVRAGAETVKFARTLNPLDPYNISHPWQFVNNQATMLAGLTNMAANPQQIPKAILGEGWGNDPADAFGAAIGNLFGGKGAGGLAKGAAKGAGRAGMRAGAKGAARGSLGKGGNGIRNFARDMKCKIFGGDPIDMATGRMALPQTDVTLPGSLPLAFARTFESSYRAGGWFGPTWASTADQRLEIDAEGVVLVTEEGSLLAFPHPAVGVPTLPAEGSRRSLELLPGGDYLLTDAATGKRWYFSTVDEDLALLDEISDRHGHRITFDYDDETGAPAAITHSAGYQLKLTTADRRITALHLAAATPDGEDQLLLTYGYDSAGNLTTVTNSSGRPTTFGYDPLGRITSWTDTNDSHYAYVYDELDRCTSQGGAEGHLRNHYSYLPRDPETGLRTTLRTDSLGHTTQYLVDDALQVVAETDATGATTRTTYDRYDRVLSTTDPLGRTNRYTYSEDGHLTSVTRPDGSRTTITRNDLGMPVTVTDPSGATWRHTYSGLGNLTSTTDPLGAVTAYTYDHRGHPTSVTDALGGVTHLRCNEAGLPLSVTDPLGAVTAYTRDAFGRIITVTDPLGAATHLFWTVEGRLSARLDPNGGIEEWTYDGEGNCTSHTDAVGRTTTFEYTHFDLLAARTDPDGVRHTFTHDTELRLTQVTNPQGLTWDYAYDPVGRLLSETDFDDRPLTYTHDPAGQLTSRTNALGEVTTYTRDPLGRIVTKDAAGRRTTYTHTPTGALASATGPDATLTYTRDAVGRVLTESVNGRTLSFTYDSLGRRVSRRTPTGAVTTYTYDAAGNRSAMTVSGHTLDFTHDAAGQELTRTVDAALALTHTWDPTGRLLSQSLASSDREPLQHRSYTYRPDGNLTSVDDSLTGRRTFDLDRAGRVTAVHAANWSESYAYDEAGNQTHANWPATHPHSSARGDRSYTGTLITTAGSIRYEHDPLGRATLRQKTRLSRKPDTWRYTWNTEDHLTSVTTPDGTLWRYLYDPLGRRTTKQRLSPDATTVLESTHFTWDGPTLTEQTTHTPSAPDSITLTWDHQGLTPLTQTERKTSVLSDAPQPTIDERFFTIITDLIGTPTELVSPTGDVAWQSRTTLWGTTTWPRNATAYTPLRFPGQYFDPETQLHYNYFRTYDPTTGRYLSPDPLGLWPAPNPVGYVPNPHAWADPFGLTPCDRFRADTRRPDEVFRDGFEPRGDNMSLEEHVYGISGDYTPPSGYVATTESSNHAFSRLKTTDGHVYLIRDAEDGINVNKRIPDNPLSHEREIAFPRKIESSSIVGAWDKNRKWTPNPHYGGPS